MTRRAIPNEEVARCGALIERSGVAEWLEAAIEARYRRPGRPRELSVAALLTALLLLATDDRALHLSAATEVLFARLSDEAKATLGVTGDVGDVGDARSFLARYRQVRYLFHAITSVLDPSGLAKNHRLTLDEFALRCVELGDDEVRDARTRLESFMGAMLSASVGDVEPPRALAYGLDATAVPLFSRGPSKRSGLCASDPDGGWYVREGDHREREDHRGRTRSRVAWALEATLLTTASPEPGSLAAFPNLVVGLALERPGVDPGGTALRVLSGARSRGFSPGPLGVDRAYSGALSTVFHLPVRAMGFALVIDYRVDQLGRQANSHGAVLVEGAWYCPGMPEALVRRSTCAPGSSTSTPIDSASTRDAPTNCDASPGPTPTATNASCVRPRGHVRRCAANCVPPPSPSSAREPSTHRHRHRCSVHSTPSPSRPTWPRATLKALLTVQRSGHAITRRCATPSKDGTGS